MTLQPVTITEEVIKDGVLQTVTRETLQLVTDPVEEAAREVAISVHHPDFISAQDRIYTANADGTSSSSKRPEPVELPDFSTMTVAQLRDYADEHDIDLGSATLKADILAALQA